MTPHDDQELIQEQIAYYDRAATQWEEISVPPDDPFVEQTRVIRQAIDDFAPHGEVLEIACGQGQLTERLLEHDVSVTALDSSPEMIVRHKQKIADDRVRYVQADLFAWQPDRAYDVVASSYWISHIPPTRFEEFWNLMRRCLNPEGRVFFVDEMTDAWRYEPLNEKMIESQPTPLVERTLPDGSTHRVVKVFWEPAELEARLGALRWDIEVHPVWPFMWGAGSLTT